MKNIILSLSAFLVLSCSDNNPVNENSNTAKDLLLFSYDSLVLRGFDTCFNQYNYTVSDTIIKNVKITFTGDTDFDSTSLSVIVQGSNNVFLNYLRLGISQIKTNHSISCDVSLDHTYYFYIGIISVTNNVLHYIKLNGIKVYKIN